MKYNYKRDGFYYPLVLFSLEQAKTYRNYLEDAEKKNRTTSLFCKNLYYDEMGL